MNCCFQSLTSNDIEVLMRAAATGNQEYIQSCLTGTKKSISNHVHIKDRFGQTAAHWSAYRGQIHILKMLIENGASMSIKDMDGRVCLHWAVRKERTSCVHYLLSQGSPTDHQTKGTGETALHKAARQGNFEICQLLCVAGCKRSICTSHNQTALEIAKEMRQLELDYAEKEKQNKEEEKKLWAEEEKEEEEKEEEEKKETKEAEETAIDVTDGASTNGDCVAVDKIKIGKDETLTDVQKSKKKSYPTDRSKESPYVNDVSKEEVEEDNKFGPIVELLTNFTDDMINPESLIDQNLLNETKGKRKRGKKLKRKSTIYSEDAPMAEVYEEKLRSGSMSDGKKSSCVVC